MTGETYPSDNNEANYTDETAFIPDENVSEAAPVSDEMVDEVVKRAEVSANGEKGKISRRAFLGTLAAAIAFANGCSKDKLPESSPSETGDEGTKITDTATDTTESAVDIDTSTVTVTETSETEKKKGKPVVEKAVGEYDSYNDYYVYEAGSVEVTPGVDYRDYLYKNSAKIQSQVSGEYPGGYLNMEEWLGEIGVDKNDIYKEGPNRIVLKNDNGISVKINPDGGLIFYSVGEKIVCAYEDGTPTVKNNRIYMFENTPEDEFSYLTTMSENSADVLEVFINAYLDGYTGDPLAKK
ncbi:hypothetical protein IKH83_00750 [Candidatus Saccharibacteria bacterium]|nr:hypothetical protein [Candidatus Saccharibacteria bacterium]